MLTCAVQIGIATPAKFWVFWIDADIGAVVPAAAAFLLCARACDNLLVGFAGCLSDIGA